MATSQVADDFETNPALIWHRVSSCLVLELLWFCVLELLCFCVQGQAGIYPVYP